ncbi:MAG: ABC transporter ATP-binding protein [Oscillospiraceae bacterium]
MAGRKPDKAAVSWLFARTKGRRGALAAIVAGNAVFAAAGAAFSLLCRGIIDCAVAGDTGGIWGYAAGLAGFVVLQLVLRLVCNSLSEYVRAKIEMDMRGELFGKLLSSELGAVTKYHSGELLNRMFSDVRICAEGITNIVPSAVNMATRLVCAGAIMIALEPWFALLFVAAGVVVFAVTRFFRGRLKGLHKQVQEKEGRVRSFLQESVESAAVIKVFGAEQKMIRQNDENQQEHFRSRMKRRTIGIISGAGFGLIFQAGYVLALVWGAFGILGGGMTYGTLMAVLQLVNQIQAPFAEMSSLFPQYYAAEASAERIMELEALPEEREAEKKLGYADFSEVTVSGLRFSYGENEVISSADLTLKKGEITALTGISGGGKSTLFMLLLGAYQPQAGEIRFCGGGGSFRAGRETRGIFAYVPQGNCLFSGTIRENIAFLRGGREISDEEVIAAARAACAEEFIEQLPQGLDTRIGENGFGLSEGQAQRIAVARALFSGAGFLLLDEATSALDEQTEKRLLENIAAMDGKTVLIVTHRPAALDICGRRLTLKDGVIEEI